MKNTALYPTQGEDFIPKIVEVVCKETGIPPIMLGSKTRKREIVEARQIAMTLAKYFTKCSLRIIGEQIGMKDHATVLHANKTINNLCETNKGFNNRFVLLYEAVGQLTLKHQRDHYVCAECGTNEVQIRAWIDVNTRKIVDNVSDGETQDSYCIYCEKPVVILLKSEFVKFNNLQGAKEREAEDKVRALQEEFQQKQRDKAKQDYHSQLSKMEKSLGV